MSGTRWRPWWAKEAAPKAAPREYPLDHFSLDDITQWGRHGQQVRDFYQNFFWEVRQRRSKHLSSLEEALNQVAHPFIFENWTRVVNHRWSNDPLSTKGSVWNAPGGRFNIGDFEDSRYQAFHALYLAENFGTAYGERFGISQIESKSGLTGEQLALCEGTAFTAVSVRGHIEKAIELDSPAKLDRFVTILSAINQPNELVEQGTAKGYESPTLVQSSSDLLKALLDPEWRVRPMQVECPSTSQEFGEIAWRAGIQGVVYPSRTGGGRCIAVFPSNLDACRKSYVELQEDAPKECKNRVLNGTTWNNFV